MITNTPIKPVHNGTIQVMDTVINATSLIRAANKQISQERIAKLSNTSQPTISRYLSGDTARIGRDVENRIKFRLENHLHAVEFMGDVYLMRTPV